MEVAVAHNKRLLDREVYKNISPSDYFMYDVMLVGPPGIEHDY